MKTKSTGFLFDDQGLLLRLIHPTETSVLKEAVRINNEVWGEHLASNLQAFRDRATNGYVIGAFKGDTLTGTISGIGGCTKTLEQARRQPGHRYNTWDGITSHGTFAQHESDPDILFCVAVTAAGRGRVAYHEIPARQSGFLDFARDLAAWRDRDDPEFAKIVQRIADALAREYCFSDLDYVLRFQRRPKAGGIVRGAKITDILPGGRPDDLDSFGYNVLLRYPEPPGPGKLPQKPEFKGVGEALVVAAVYLVAGHPTLRVVMPYSRPAQFRSNLIKAMVSAVTGSLPRDARPGFDVFTQHAAQVVKEFLGPQI